MIVKWHGTASVELINSTGRLLIDPFVPLKHSNVPVKLEDYDGFSDILITHGHFDHIMNLPEIVKRNPDVKIYCSKTPCHTLLGKGIPARNLEMISYGQTINIGDFEVIIQHGRHAVLPKINFSMILGYISAPERGNIPLVARENSICKENDETLFFTIKSEGKIISLMGSLNIRDDVSYPIGADLLVLPYNGWDDNYPPAVKVIEKLNPKRVVLDHYDVTFPPFTKPLDLSPILGYEKCPVSAMSLDKEVII